MSGGILDGSNLGDLAESGFIKLEFTLQ